MLIVFVSFVLSVPVMHLLDPLSSVVSMENLSTVPLEEIKEKAPKKDLMNCRISIGQQVEQELLNRLKYDRTNSYQFFYLHDIFKPPRVVFQTA